MKPYLVTARYSEDGPGLREYAQAHDPEHAKRIAVERWRHQGYANPRDVQATRRIVTR